MLTKTEIHAFLKQIGIRPWDTVLVHTSMRALGEVEGGCDGLIDAFVSYLSEGLFLVPTHTWKTVNKDQAVYDVSESVPCVGALPTVAAFRKDGVRSLHPTHSVAAFGKRAAEFVKGEELATSPCFAGGVWYRLLEEEAKILLLGVDLSVNTYIHAVDEMIEPELPERLSEKPVSLTVIDREGKRYSLTCRMHYRSGSRFFENYRKPLEKFGALKNAFLGNARVGIFYAAKATKVLKMLWSKAEYDLCEDFKEIPDEYYRDEKID